MNVLVFDIETVPDVTSGRRLYNLESSLSDQAVAKAMIQKRKDEAGTDFLRLHLQQVVAISVVLEYKKNNQTQVKVWSVAEPNSSEKEIIQRFFEGIDKFSPTLVSWNGMGFDLPVLHYRSLLHGVQAPRYWETGQTDGNFRYNNYINRYHDRHTDLMDVLASYQAKAYARLDDIAVLLGFPGKMGMSGAKVWESYLHGDVVSIRHYCETDVLNTYLVYLRFQLIQGKLQPQEYQANCEQLKHILQQQSQSHLHEFLAQWQKNLSP